MSKTTFSRLTSTEPTAVRARLDALASLGIDLALIDLPDLADPPPFALLRDLSRHYAAAGRSEGRRKLMRGTSNALCI